jgi:hypothetical protein
MGYLGITLDVLREVELIEEFGKVRNAAHFFSKSTIALLHITVTSFE